MVGYEHTPSTHHGIRPGGRGDARDGPGAQTRGRWASVVPTLLVTAVPRADAAAGSAPRHEAGRAIPRANVDRLQATASHTEPLSCLLKCPASHLERCSAMPGR